MDSLGVREEPLRWTAAGLQLVKEVAVVDDELSDTFRVVDFVHEGAILARGGASDLFELLDLEVHILEGQRFDACVRRNAVNALLTAGTEEIQTVRHA